MIYGWWLFLHAQHDPSALYIYAVLLTTNFYYQMNNNWNISQHIIFINIILTIIDFKKKYSWLYQLLLSLKPHTVGFYTSLNVNSCRQKRSFCWGCVYMSRPPSCFLLLLLLCTTLFGHRWHAKKTFSYLLLLLLLTFYLARRLHYGRYKQRKSLKVYVHKSTD